MSETPLVTDTFNATIYIGYHTKKGTIQGHTDYTPFNRMSKRLHELVNQLQVCLSIEHLSYTYPNIINFYGDVLEPGVAITIINYPKFPKHKDQILDLAESIGKTLMKEFSQRGFSIVCTDKTYYFSNPDNK